MFSKIKYFFRLNGHKSYNQWFESYGKEYYYTLVLHEYDKENIDAILDKKYQDYKDGC